MYVVIWENVLKVYVYQFDATKRRQIFASSFLCYHSRAYLDIITYRGHDEEGAHKNPTHARHRKSFVFRANHFVFDLSYDRTYKATHATTFSGESVKLTSECA